MPHILCTYRDGPCMSQGRQEALVFAQEGRQAEFLYCADPVEVAAAQSSSYLPGPSLAATYARPEHGNQWCSGLFLLPVLVISQPQPGPRVPETEGSCAAPWLYPPLPLILHPLYAQPPSSDLHFLKYRIWAFTAWLYQVLRACPGFDRRGWSKEQRQLSPLLFISLMCFINGNL